jgi:F-box and leucine-rich repeat protein 2/20
MRFLAHTPRLTSLILRQCDGFTDDGVGVVIRACKLESLIVEGCSRVSQHAIEGPAKSVHYDKNYPGLLNLGRVELPGRMKCPLKVSILCLDPR